MSTEVAKLQDLPPRGGYGPINYKRVFPRSYFNGWAIFGGYIAITAGASYLYYLNSKTLHNEDIEMRSARFAIYPLLYAERDRAFLKQLRKNRDEEASLMANVEGWKVGTLYGEPLYKTVPEDDLKAPSMLGYYIHADLKEFKRRAHMSLWS